MRMRKMILLTVLVLLALKQTTAQVTVGFTGHELTVYPGSTTTARVKVLRGSLNQSATISCRSRSVAGDDTIDNYMYDYVFPTITLSQYQTTANVDIYIPSSGSEIGGQTFELILSTHDSRVAVIDPYADALRVYIVATGPSLPGTILIISCTVAPGIFFILLAIAVTATLCSKGVLRRT